MLTGRRFALAGLFARMQEEPRLRQRAAALGGVSMFFAGALIAVGLGQVVLLLVGVAVIGGVVVLIVSRVSREELLRMLRRPSAAQTWRTVTVLLERAVRSATSASMSLKSQARRSPGTRATQSVARGVRLPTVDELHGWPYAGSEEASPEPSPSESANVERRRALDLNARGSHLRRAGKPTEAASQHREALEIFRSLNDRSGQALTLNSLALALRASGEIEAAVERFEQSLLILRERPEEPGQAEVIANLGFTLLRGGGDERARELLSEALEKLPPDSRAAHKVEAQLRRAS